MKRLLLPLAAIAILSMLRPLAAPPAAACSCVALPKNEDQIEKYLQDFDAVVIGEARQAPLGASHPDKVYIDVLRTFKGPALSLIPASQPLGWSPEHDGPTGMCGYTLAEKSRARHFLALTASPDGTYSPSGCGSFPISAIYAPQAEFLLALENFNNTGAPSPPVSAVPAATASGDDGFPWMSVAGAAALGAFAGAGLLAASALLLRWRPNAPKPQ